jgi:NADH dehydrogenase
LYIPPLSQELFFVHRLASRPLFLGKELLSIPASNPLQLSWLLPGGSMHSAHRVVILGGGFGGMLAAQALKRAPVEVTLIDRRNFHLFQPLLYQVATGSLSPGEIAAPLRGVLSRQKNTQVLLGEACDIDPVAGQITLRDGAQFAYDTLIVSTGSQTSYYGNDAWREWAPSLKSVEEATAIRHKILYAFERAERASSPEEARTWLTFVIVGAGATGLELAGALAEIARETLRHDFRHINPTEARIILMEGGPRILTAFPEDLSLKAEKLLARLGVEVLKNVFATHIDAHGVTYKQNEESKQLAAKTVLWAGGVTSTEFGKKLAERTQSRTDRSGRITVNPDLTIPNYPNIFIVGDLALSLQKDGKPLPGVAQAAMQGGAFVAKTIRARVAGKKPPPAFHYVNKGDMAVIGRAAAVANIFGFHLSGLAAWLVWLFIHLLYLVEFQSRVLVFIQWGFEFLTFSRGARLITGTAATDSLDKDAALRSRDESD